MNAILAYLQHNRERLRLDQYGVQGELATVVLTPRFRASSHVVWLIFNQGAPTPVLVAKVPRMADRFVRLEQEAANLQMIQMLRPDGFASVPALVAFEPFHDRAILVETALTGQPMDPAFVRRHPDRCCSVMADWLPRLQWSAAPAQSAERFARLVDAPYRYFTERFPVSREEERLLDQTWGWLTHLRDIPLPSVFEHGDLSHPNLFLTKRGEPGIVDWETADPYGLPACDLFFFLTYVALSKHKSRSTGSAVAAFRSAFWGDQAWAQPYVAAYARRLQLPGQALPPLFILCWLRYMVSLLSRIEQDSAPDAPLRSETATWLRANRFYALWKEAVINASELAAWGSHDRSSGQKSSNLVVAQ